jgi:cobalt-zinc-cadmium efflux system outer membrane protein
MSKCLAGRRKWLRRARILIATAACLPLPLGSRLARANEADGREKVVSLTQLLEFASTHAPATRLARASRALGEAARAGASPLLRDNPSVSFAAGPRTAQGRPSALDLSASLAQPIEIAGERGLRRDVARRFSERLEAEAGSTLAEVRRDVDVAYHAAVVARERVAVSTRLVVFAEQALVVARRRLDAGDITSIEVTLAEADLSRAREALLRAEQMFGSARLDLATSAGWPPRTPPLVAAGLAPVEPIPELATVLQRAIEQHPELAAQRAAEREAHARVELADREAWPAPTLGVQLVREGSVGSPANFIVLGSVEVGLPLWSRNQEERGRNRAEEQIASERAALVARALETRVLAAHAALAAAGQRITLLVSHTAGAFEQGLVLLERGLASGEFSALLVSATRERLAQTELLALDAFADYYRARAELTHALGAVPNGPSPSGGRPAPRAGTGGTP